MPSRTSARSGIDVAVVERGHGVAAIDRLLQGPDVDLLAAAGLGGAVVLDARTRSGTSRPSAAGRPGR